jgi:hypothetical protein
MKGVVGLAWLLCLPPLVAQPTQAPLEFSGGHETDPRDHGRPVVLIAAALNVPPQVFREAFSHVHPAPAGSEPEAGQVRANKQALLAALGPYGVTNDRLDEVSNFYRYRPGPGSLWKNRPAAGFATLVDGRITGIVLQDGGAGYSSAPAVSVAGAPVPHALVRLYFGTDLARNGSILGVDLSGR